MRNLAGEMWVGFQAKRRNPTGTTFPPAAAGGIKGGSHIFPHHPNEFGCCHLRRGDTTVSHLFDNCDGFCDLSLL